MNGNKPDNEQDLSDIENESDLPIAEEGPPVQLYDIPLDELLSDQASEFTPEEIKKVKKYSLIGLAVLLVVIALSVYACQPKKGSMAYGLCSTFLELNTPYPHTLNYTGLEGSRTAVRIYFTSIDPFGQFKQETIECKFGADEKGGMKMTEVLRNRHPVEADAVKKFNQTLPTVMASDPYRVMPPHWENQLIPR